MTLWRSLWQHFFWVISLFFFLLWPTASLAENAACPSAWSQAFDQATNHLLEAELPPFFLQNTVSGADIWAGYRTLSLRHECLLRTICEVSVNNRQENDILASRNQRGGIVPGAFFSCPLGEIDTSPKTPFDITVQQVFQSAGIQLLPLQQACVSLLPREKDEILEEKNRCLVHAAVSQEVFDRLLQTMILKDINRKRMGYLSKKITSLSGRIQEITSRLHVFVVNANSFFARVCPLKRTN